MSSKIIQSCLLVLLTLLFISCAKSSEDIVTVPIKYDHNRILVEAEIQKKDGTWRNVLLWVDTGNPNFFISESLGEDLGIDLSTAHEEGFDVVYSNDTQINLRIGDMLLDFSSPKKKVVLNPKWLFTTMNIDANIPSTVLMKYQVVFDNTAKTLTLAKSGKLAHQGELAPALINRETGIVQIKADHNLSFALDNGASYSFITEKAYSIYKNIYPNIPVVYGAAGCANIWGWWPKESEWLVTRIPRVEWGTVGFSNVGVVVLPNEFSLFDEYSKKTVSSVDGLLGPNILNSYRVEIDYTNNSVYFEKTKIEQADEMNIVGITLRPELDGNYSVLGIVNKDDVPVVEGVYKGDILIMIDDMNVKGKTMGTVVDALRGKPGDTHTLQLERNGKRIEVKCKVKHLL